MTLSREALKACPASPHIESNIPRPGHAAVIDVQLM